MTPFDGRGPLALYVHVPFCTAKCPYCAFPSAPPGEGDEDRYLEGIGREVRFWASRLKRRGLSSLYVGGGTPTRLSPSGWERLIRFLEEAFSFRSSTEITVEANPESLSPEHLEIWGRWRPLRVSLGVQSFRDEELVALGRLHDGARAREAAMRIRRQGIPLGLDLMFGIPRQTLRTFAESLREALSLDPEHLSLYQLMLEEGTPFGESPPEGRAEEGYPFYRYAQWRLPRAGYGQYEIASFALPGRWRRHNLRYWLGGDFLGLGPGAWGCLGGWRYRNDPTLTGWRARTDRGRSAALWGERLSGERKAREEAILALRTRWGWSPGETSRRFGLPVAEAVEADLLPFEGAFVRRQGVRWVLTPRGFQVANRIWEALV
ncbi:radical SAM family heme chaperone HemW [Aminomonas paucivorans]|uniref:radical SAM family heme chaperone HemW n=1 Tax=Aminomonas paucivorans TaxID=81412 RepID=UPI003333DFDA